MTRRDGITETVSERTGRRSWRARVSWIATDGRRLHRSRSFPTRKRAEQWRRTTLADVDRGEWFEAATEPLAEIAARWLAGIERGRAGSTYRGYESVYRTHVAPRFGSTPIGRIQPTDVQHFLDELATRYSDDMVRAVHRVLRGIFTHAVSDGLIRTNPSDGRRLPQDAPTPPQAWTADEARRFLAHVEGDDNALLFVVLLATGLRLGEALALAWDAVDLDARLLRVERTLQATKAGQRISDMPKTARSRRTVALPARAVLALRRQRALADGNLVFAAWHGGTRDPNTCRERLAKLCRAADVPPLTPHGLRRTMVTLALMAGIPPKVVAEQTGHSVTIMLERYQAVSVAMQRQAATAMDDVLDTGHGGIDASDRRHGRG